MKNLTRILSSFSFILVMALTARSQDVFKVAPVGIGTASPLQALDVSGNVKFAGALMPNGNAGLVGNILLSGGALPNHPTWLANGVTGQVLTATGTGVVYKASGYWNLTGNAGTTPGVNYVGTNDDQPIYFYSASPYAGNSGSLDPNYESSGTVLKGNVYLGTPNGNNGVGGAGNTDAGNLNVAFGFGSMGNNSSSATGNVAVGDHSNAHNSGNYNVALGGLLPLWNNNSASGNIGIGAASLSYADGGITPGNDNTAIGYQSMYYYVGAYNTAIGYNALAEPNNSTSFGAVSNTAIGNSAAYNTYNNKNTAVGDSALSVNTTGANNTALGYGATNTSAALSNAIAIGYNVSAPLSNTITLGNTSSNKLYLPGYPATGSLFYVSAASGLVTATGPGTSGYLLESNGPGVAPTWASVSPSSGTVTSMSATAPMTIAPATTWLVGIQGTGANAGGVLYSAGGGTSALFTSAGTQGQLLQYNGPGAPTWVANPNALAWNFGGGNIISATYGTNFIGTLSGSTSPTLEFYGQSQATASTGRLDPINQNVYFGGDVNGDWTGGGGGTSIVSGSVDNVAIGNSAMGGSVSGTSNDVFIGYAAGLPFSCLSIAGAPNVGGNGDAIVGDDALRWYTSGGVPNTALGLGAINGNIGAGGTNNIGVGFSANGVHTSGLKDVAIGAYSLGANTTTSNNTAVGYYANEVGSGTGNSALGYYSLEASSGSFNTGVGYEALLTNTSGANNTGIGASSNVSSGALTNATAVGYTASATLSNSVFLGNSSVSFNLSTGSGIYVPSLSAPNAPLYVSAANGKIASIGTGTSGYLLQSNGPGVAPSWANVTFGGGAVTSITGTAPIVVTGAWTIGIQDPSNNKGGILYSLGGGTPAAYTATGTAGQVLQSNGTGAPTWFTPVISAAGDWNVAGGNAISATYGTNFLGTLSGSGAGPQLQFKVNNLDAGTLDPVNDNIYFGGNVSSFYPGGDINTTTGVTPGVTNNVAIGFGSFGGLTANSDNIASGTTDNVYVGYTSGYNSSVTGGGKGSTGIGALSLRNAEGAPNTAFGFSSLRSPEGANETGANNTALGYEAELDYTTGSRNVAVGNQAMEDISTGTNNTAVGFEPLFTNTTGSNNTAVGYEALHSTSTQTGNTAIGYFALEVNTVPGRNVAIGANTASTANDNGQEALIGTGAGHSFSFTYYAEGPDVVIGDSAYYSDTEPWKNVAIGYLALRSQTSTGANYNTALGFGAMEGSATFLYTTAIGTNALYRTTATNEWSTVIGAGAAMGTSVTNETIALGTGAMGSTVNANSGTLNIAIGGTNGVNTQTTAAGTFASAALAGATLGTLSSGAENLAIGYGAGNALTTGTFNTLIGYNAANTYGATTGIGGIAIGANSQLPATLTNEYNIAVGYAANAANGTHTTSENFYNVALGAFDTAGVETVSSSFSFYNLAIGSMANASPTTTSSTQASSGLAIGYQARARAQGSIAIGANAFANTANTIILGAITGVNGGTSVNVGINTATPAQKLEIGSSGTLRVDGLGSTGTIYNLLSPSLISDQVLFAKASGDVYSMPQGTNGQELVINSSGIPAWGYPTTSFTASSPLSFIGNAPQVLVLSGTSGGVLYGTASSPTPGGVAFTAAGAVDSILGVNGSLVPTFVNANAVAGPNDQWGNQSVVTDSLLTHGIENTVTGNGLAGSPLKLAHQGAVPGQALVWNGTSWVPTVVSTYVVGTTTNVVPTSPVTATNPNGRLVGGTNATIGIAGTAGGVLVGEGAGTSAQFVAGTSGQFLTSNGPGVAASFQTLTAPLWKTTGNAGTTPGTNFLGTNDDQPIYFYSASPYAGNSGSLDPNYEKTGSTLKGNVYLGTPNGNNSVGGAGNTDAGTLSVAFGFGAMGNNGANATLNVAIGDHSNAHNTGNDNTTLGGDLAMWNNYGANGNTAIGATTLSYGDNGVTPGNDNTAIGYQSMWAYVGPYNTTAGYNTLYGATAATPTSNTGMGNYAIYNTYANKNTAVGDSALYTNTTGESNAGLGWDADNTGTLTNATSVGAQSYATQNNTIVLGQISGFNGATHNTNVAIGTNTPKPDAALAIKHNHIESQGQLATGNVYPDILTGGAGTGATTSITNATDIGGSISLTTGTGTGSGSEVTVLFSNPYTYTPIVTISPANAAAAKAMTAYGAYVSVSNSSFTINFNSAPLTGTTYNFNYFIIETPGVLSGNIPCNIPITLSNTQSSATPTGFQQMLTVNSSAYSSMEMSGLQNVEFSVGGAVGSGGTALQAWIESGATSSSTSTVYWVNLGSHTIAATSGTLVIYMNFMPSSVMSATGPTGEAPQLSGTYGQYDNGSYVFGANATVPEVYDNFAGSSIKAMWTQNTGDGITIAQSNGMTISSPGGTYGGIILTAGLNNSSSIPVFDGDVTSVSGVAAGIGLMSGLGNSTGGIIYSYWGSNPYTDGGGSIATGVWGPPGMANGNNPNITLEPGIDGGAWVSGSSQYWESPYPSPYTIYTGTQTAYGAISTLYPSIGIYYSSNGSVINFQWVRAHLYAPNGVNPTASYGGTTCANSQPADPNPCSVPVTLTNTTSSATPSNFAQMVTVNSANYATEGEAANLNNVEFTTGPQGTGTVLQTWIESGNSSSSTSTVYWVNLGSASVPAHGSLTIYIDFMSSSVLSAAGPTGEAPQLSGATLPAYGEYDNGTLVFPEFYDNFSGTSLASKWTNAGGATPSVNNGLTLTYTGPNWWGIYENTFSGALGNVAESYCEATATSTGGLCFNTSGTNGNGINTGTNGVDLQLDGQYMFGGDGSCTSAPGTNAQAATSSPAANTLYDFSFFMLSTPVSQINYGAFNTLTDLGSSGATGTVSPNSEVGLGVSGANGFYQWFRIRPSLASSSTMPSASFGAISCCATPPSMSGNTISGSSTFCPNTAGIIYSVASIGGGYTYTWSVPSGSTITAGQGTTSITVTSGTTAGTVSVAATNTCGGEGTPSTLSVAPTFSITGQPVNASYSCPGTNPTYTVTTSGAVTGYQWQVSTNGGGSWTSLSNTAPYSGVTTATLTISSPSTTLNGYEYQCIVTGSCTSLTSNAATLSVGTAGLSSVKITLTNSQSSATPAGFQQQITVNSSSYTSDGENANLNNVEFTTGPAASGTPLYAWLESVSPATVPPTSASTSSVYWVNLGSTIIPAGGSINIYMNFMPSAVVGVPTGATAYTGEAPQISTTYAQYDNGSLVFPQLYDNFAGTTVNARWSPNAPAGTSQVQNNGITCSTTTSVDGGLILAAGISNSPNAQIFDGDVTAVSGVASGIGLDYDNTAGVGYYNGYNFNFWSGSTSWGSQSNGEGVNNNPTLLISTGIMGIGWLSGTSQVYYKNYVATSGAATNYTPPSTLYPIMGEWNGSTNSSIALQWVRTHYYAPNGTMPTASGFSYGCY